MKNIIVVTGASSGMGNEFVRQIDRKEKVDEIWVIARREDRLLALSQKCKNKIRAIPLDLTKQQELEQYNKLLDEEQPNIKILCNASGYGKINHYENEELNTYLDMIDLNVKAIVSMINFSLPFMHPGSKIMNLDSVSGYFPLPYLTVYAATKAFILSYSRSLNVELQYRGIHVLAVCPYWVKTEFFKRASKDRAIKNYYVMYNAKRVIRRAIKDLDSSKDVSKYGLFNKMLIFTGKVVPHRTFMKVWMKIQNFNGKRSVHDD